MFEDVADEKDAVNSGSPAGFIHMDPLFSQACSAVGRTAGARSARRIPMLRMAIERSRGILRARLGQIRD